MQFFAKVFVLVLIANSSLAADPNSETFAKKIATTSKWDTLLTGFRDSLNPLVRKELTELTQDAVFPSMRVQKDRLIISNENGEYLTVVFFKKNGAVTLNGKEWILSPLATPAAEVKRITEILTSRTSLLDFFEPSAYAAGMGMTKGVAAAAYTSAAAWKGLNCAMPQLSDEALRTCPLMAVGMQSLTPMNPDAPVTPDTHYPVNLKCPVENKGKLELITRKINGVSAKLEVSYNSGSAGEVTFSLSEDSNGFRQIFSLDPSTVTDSRFKPVAQKGKAQGDVLMKAVCEASKENRIRFNELAAANSIQLKKSSSLEPVESDKKSSSGI